MIVIVDYGMGNLRSVYNKFVKMGYDCAISSKEIEILAADKLILPGVGHFKAGILKLDEMNIRAVLNEKVTNLHTPILGICLGAQLFAEHSEEGDCEGLGWIDANVVKFRISDRQKYKVPHMGWNTVKIVNHVDWDSEIKDDDAFYFVHSFHLLCNNQEDIWMTTDYEYEFVSSIHRENIYGTQFHPEKSHDAGINLLKKFAEL